MRGSAFPYIGDDKSRARHRKQSIQEQTRQNELRRHRDMLTEWLQKRAEATQAIAQHRAAIRKLERQAKRLARSA